MLLRELLHEWGQLSPEEEYDWAARFKFAGIPTGTRVMELARNIGIDDSVDIFFSRDDRPRVVRFLRWVRENKRA